MMNSRARRRIAISSFLIAGIAGAALPDEVDAATFTLNDGKVIRGDIIEISGGFVFIRQPIGGMFNGGVGMIQSIDFTLPDDDVVRGRLQAWEDGVYAVLQEESGDLVKLEASSDGSYRVISVISGNTIRPSSVVETPSVDERVSTAEQPASVEEENATEGESKRREPVM